MKYSCLPDKVDGLVASGEDGLAGCEEGRLSSVAFIHHQDHVEKPVENSPQGLDSTHISLDSNHPFSVQLRTKITHHSFLN